MTAPGHLIDAGGSNLAACASPFRWAMSRLAWFDLEAGFAWWQPGLILFVHPPTHVLDRELDQDVEKRFEVAQVGGQ